MVSDGQKKIISINERWKLTAVHRINSGKRNKQANVRLAVADAVQTQPDRRQDGHAVLAAVDEMGKHIARVTVTPDTLQGTPDGRERVEEAENTRVCRVALVGVVPALGVQAKEEFDVLPSVSQSELG